MKLSTYAHTLPRFLTTTLILLALVACSPEPSSYNILLNLQETIVKQTIGMLTVTAAKITDTERPAVGQINYKVIATFEIPANMTAVADKLVVTPVRVSPLTGQLQVTERDTPLDVFLRAYGWTTPAIQEFLEGDRKAEIPLGLRYVMESKDVWTLKEIQHIPNPNSPEPSADKIRSDIQALLDKAGEQKNARPGIKLQGIVEEVEIVRVEKIAGNQLLYYTNYTVSACVVANSPETCRKETISSPVLYRLDHKSDWALQIARAGQL